jgi:hypothetical protein
VVRLLPQAIGYCAPSKRKGENMKPAPTTPKHETVLKQLRHERYAEVLGNEQCKRRLW